MFNMLTVGYLFSGGAGAGALVVLSVLELANLRERYPFVGRKLSRRDVFPYSDTRLALPDRVFSWGWTICLVALGVGILCLFVDLGRPDRVFNLLVSPEFSALTIGAYSLVIALICALVFFLLSVFEGISPARGIIVALSILAIVSGFVVMIYTGHLLSSMPSILFWQTPLLVIVFLLSSLSCGIALLFLGASFVEARHPFVLALVQLCRIDGVLLGAELLCLLAYVAWALNGQGTALAAESLIYGSLSWLFWFGLIGCGIVTPLVIERFIKHSNYQTQLLWVAVFLLIGGLALRICVVEAAQYDVTQTTYFVQGAGSMEGMFDVGESAG